jgi:DNA-directed RNA polymerase subunit RPC12/RpoP
MNQEEELTMNQPETTYEDSDVRCPYCLKMQSDSWELGNGGEYCDTMECGSCGREFIWSRTIMISYKGIPITNDQADPRRKEDHE